MGLNFRSISCFGPSLWFCWLTGAGAFVLRLGGPVSAVAADAAALMAAPWLLAGIMRIGTVRGRRLVAVAVAAGFVVLQVSGEAGAVWRQAMGLIGVRWGVTPNHLGLVALPALGLSESLWTLGLSGAARCRLRPPRPGWELLLGLCGALAACAVSAGATRAGAGESAGAATDTRRVRSAAAFDWEAAAPSGPEQRRGELEQPRRQWQFNVTAVKREGLKNAERSPLKFR